MASRPFSKPRTSTSAWPSIWQSPTAPANSSYRTSRPLKRWTSPRSGQRYEELVRRARGGKLEVSDFAGTTISLTNPGTIGTNHSVPRLMEGQGCIVGVGAMEYPADWQGASEEAIVRNAVSKIMTLTSTYDHRIIQGAQSGEFLRRMHQLLLGEDDFYGEIFRSLRIPYEPVRWSHDLSASHETDLDKTVRVQESSTPTEFAVT
jgi:2-oxoglutarate decarboxylase